MQAAAVQAVDNGAVAKSPSLDQSLARAHKLAVDQGHPFVTLEHLLFALTDDPEVLPVLASSKVAVDRLRSDASVHMGRLSEQGERPGPNGPQPGADLLRIVQLAATAARQSPRKQIDGAIILAAIVGDANSPSAGMLKAHGLTFEEVIRVLQQHSLSRGNQAPPPPASPPPALQPPAEPSPPIAAPVAAAPTAPPPAAKSDAPPSTEDMLASVRARVKQAEPPRVVMRGQAAKAGAAATPLPASTPVPTPVSTPAPASTPPPAPAPQAVAMPVAAAPVTMPTKPIELPPSAAAPPPRPLPPPPSPAMPSPAAQSPVAMPPPAAANALPIADPARGPARPPLPPPSSLPPQPVAIAAPQPLPPQAPPLPPMNSPAVNVAPPQPSAINQALRHGPPSTAQRSGPPPPMPPPMQMPNPPPASAPMRSAPPPMPPAQMQPQPSAPIGARTAEPLDIIAAAAPIPAYMRAERTTEIEIAIPRSQIDSGRYGQQRQASRAVTLRLVAEPANVCRITAITPETVWLDGPPTSPDERAYWKIAATPLKPGRFTVTLSVHGRTFGPYGAEPDPSAISDTFAVRAKTPVMQVIGRIWVVLMLFAAGLVMATAGLGPIQQLIATIMK